MFCEHPFRLSKKLGSRLRSRELSRLRRTRRARLTDKQSCAAIAEQLDDLVDDNEFWRFQAHSLAIFVTPQNLRTFRVPNALQPLVIVSDRFHAKPLLRSISFPQSCYVLALVQKSVRVVEISLIGIERRIQTGTVRPWPICAGARH